MMNETLQKYRAKYPQYADMDDSTLAARIMAKYPQYADVLGDVVKPKSQPTDSGMEGIGAGDRFALGFADSPEQKIRYLAERYGKTNIYFQPSSGKIFFRPTEGDKFRPIEGYGPNMGDVAALGGDIPAMVLGTAGAVLGGGPTGGAGAAYGAGLGTAAGEAARKAIGEIGLGPSGRTSLQNAAEIAGAGLAGAAGEAVGQGLSRAAQKMISPFAKYAKSGILETSREFKFPVTSSEASESSTVDAINQFLESALGGSGEFSSFKQGRFEKAQEVARIVANRIGKPSEDYSSTGEAIKGAIQNLRARRMGEVVNRRKIPGVADLLYEKADNIIGNTNVPFGQVKQAAQKLLDEQYSEAVKRLPNSKEFIEGSKLYRLLKDINSGEDVVPYKFARQLQSALGNAADPDNIIGDVENRVAGIMKSAVDDAVEGQLKRVSPEGFAAYKKAQSYYSKNAQLFNETILSKLAKDDPSDVATELFKPKSAENARIIVSTLRKTDPELLRTVKATGIADLFSGVERKSTSGIEKLSNPTLYTRWKNLGSETKAAIFSRDELEMLDKTLKFLTSIQTGQRPEGFAGRNIMMGQFVQRMQLIGGGGVGALGATGGLGVGEAVLGIGGIWLLPKMVAKMVLSETGRKLLTEGFALSPGKKAGIGFSSRLAAYMLRPEFEGDRKELTEKLKSMHIESTDANR